MANGDARYGRRPFGGDRSTVEDGDGHPRRWIVEDDDRAQRRQPERVVRREPRDPLHPDEILRPAGVRSAKMRGHRVSERALWPRMDGDLRRQLGSPRAGEGGEGLLGEPQPLVERWHRYADIFGAQKSKRLVRPSGWLYAFPLGRTARASIAHGRGRA